MTVPHPSWDGDPPAAPLDPQLLAETLEALADRLVAQEELIAVLAADRDPATPASGPWAWQHLNESQRLALTTELDDWVSWLRERYQLGATRHQVPSCWAEHPVAVEELTALMVSWKAAYTGPARGPCDDLIAWHDRWLWPCLARLNEQLQVWNACRAGRHAGRCP